MIPRKRGRLTFDGHRLTIRPTRAPFPHTTGRLVCRVLRFVAAGGGATGRGEDGAVSIVGTPSSLIASERVPARQAAVFPKHADVVSEFWRGRGRRRRPLPSKRRAPSHNPVSDDYLGPTPPVFPETGGSDAACCVSALAEERRPNDPVGKTPPFAYFPPCIGPEPHLAQRSKVFPSTDGPMRSFRRSSGVTNAGFAVCASQREARRWQRGSRRTGDACPRTCRAVPRSRRSARHDTRRRRPGALSTRLACPWRLLAQAEHSRRTDE